MHLFRYYFYKMLFLFAQQELKQLRQIYLIQIKNLNFKLKQKNTS